MKKSLVFAALLVPALALAQPKTADDWYKEGETQYNLGNFDRAAEAFKQGFALETNDSKKPAYLYNVAQAYRQGNKCRDAAFFYKRYLSLKDQDTVKPLKPEKRAEIDQRITELEECARTQDLIAKKPPDSTMPLEPAGGKTGTGTTKTGTGTTTTGTGTTTGTPAVTGTGTTTGSTTGTGTTTATGTGAATGTGPTVAEGEGEDEGEEEGEEGESDSVTTSYDLKPRTINARFVGGLGKVSIGDLATGMKPSFALTGGYPVLTQGPLSVDVGASLNFTPMPYKNNMTGDTQNATLTTVVANAAATYTVAPKIAVRGDLGLGALLFGGLEMGNPFTENGSGTSGSLGMFAVRVGASADYAITPNVVATVTPISFAYSPAKAGLAASSILQIDIMLGVGYRM
jgi:hypothetical protein